MFYCLLLVSNTDDADESEDNSDEDGYDQV